MLVVVEEAIEHVVTSIFSGGKQIHIFTEHMDLKNQISQSVTRRYVEWENFFPFLDVSIPLNLSCFLKI